MNDRFSIFSRLTPIKSALDYHLERHNVLVSNVAHVDTPKYVPKDLARVDPPVAGPPDFKKTFEVALKQTDPRHIATSNTPGPVTGRVFEDPSQGTGADRNAVSLDREAAKIASNQIRYDVVANIISGDLAGLAWAVGDGRG